MIKKIRIIKPALLTVICIIIFLLVVPAGITKIKAASSVSMDGIDYTRLTQKAYNKLGKYDVTLSLGTMIELKGALIGTEGLSMEEMNEIIEQQMASQNLNLEEIKILSSVGRNLSKAQKKELAKKLAMAATNYIPGSVPGVSALANEIIYGDSNYQTMRDDLHSTVDKYLIEKTITKTLEDSITKPGHKVPKIKGIGLVGFAINSVYAAKDLMDDTHYDAFCKKLEEEYQKIAEFYIKCSQKMNDAVTEKNLNRRYIIFDDNSDATTEAIFLGVSGVKMRYKLRGTLRNQVTLDEFIDPDDNSGTYEGDLTLEIEAYDMENDFDLVFDEVSTLWTSPATSDWCYILHKYPGGHLKREDLRTFIVSINEHSILKRKLKGHFTLTISQHEITGPITPKLSGSFNNISDEIDFLMDMTFKQEGRVEEYDKGKYLGYPLQTWHVKGYVHGGKYIDSVYVNFSANEAYNIRNSQSVGNVLYAGGGQDMRVSSSDLGTVWYPLEYAPKIQITVPN